jgi:hypothetical protein
MDMNNWRSRLMILVVVGLSAATLPYAGGRMKREVGYHSALRSYSEALKPGMSLKNVDDSKKPAVAGGLLIVV